MQNDLQKYGFHCHLCCEQKGYEWRNNMETNLYSDEYILGQNIRKCRRAKKWSQNDLSNAMNIDRADISKYENGTKGEMGFKTLKRFAKSLGVSVEQLLNAEEEPEEGMSFAIHLFQDLTPEHQEIITLIMQALLAKQTL